MLSNLFAYTNISLFNFLTFVVITDVIILMNNNISIIINIKDIRAVIDRALQHREVVDVCGMYSDHPPLTCTCFL